MSCLNGACLTSSEWACLTRGGSSKQVHPWVTRHGAEPLPPEDDNCCALIEVTEEEVENSVKHIPSLATVVSHGATAAALDTKNKQMSSNRKDEIKLN